MHTSELPAPIAAYLDAKNRRDVDGMLHPFADDAVVRDEGEDYRGRTAIRAWLEDVTSRFGVRVDPQSVTAADAATVVSAQVAGDFPGSPVVLAFRFTLADERIARLEVG